MVAVCGGSVWWWQCVVVAVCGDGSVVVAVCGGGSVWWQCVMVAVCGDSVWWWQCVVAVCGDSAWWWQCVVVAGELSLHKQKHIFLLKTLFDIH